MSDMYKLTNVEIFTPKKGFMHGTILIKDESIAKVRYHEGPLPCLGKCTESADAVLIDATAEFAENGEKIYAVPGFLDSHIHGAMGFDVCDGTVEALEAIAKYEASRGVTCLVPATMTMGEDTLKKVGEAVQQVSNKVIEGGCSIEGLHMEGPFINPDKVGAQNPEFIHKPDSEYYQRLQKYSDKAYKVVTMAPEVEGGMDFIAANHHEISISVGHTCADYQQAYEAFAAGADRLTHCFNAMPSLHHRNPGPIAAAADHKHTWIEMITDGVHIDPAMVRLAFRIFGYERIVFVSDSMRATGLEDGEYSLGGQKVIVKGSEARLENGALAGSVTDLLACVKHAVEKMNIPLVEALTCACYNPYKALNMDDKRGTLESGKFADVLLLNEKLEPKAVWVKGRRVL